MAYNSFLENESELFDVDEDFRELVRLSYMVPGFATFGVSCAGHFEKFEEDKFWPQPEAHLNFVCIPQLRHIPKLLGIIHDQVCNDKDARFYVDHENNSLSKKIEYSLRIDLDTYPFYQTENGSYTAKLRLELGDYGTLGKEYFPHMGPILIKGNEKIFTKSIGRYLQIRNFWKDLEKKIEEYNQIHSFKELIWDKKEFKCKN